MRASISQLRREAADLQVQIAADDPREPERRAARTLAAMESHRSRLLADYAAVDDRTMSDDATLRTLYDDLATARAELAGTQSRGSVDSPRAVQLRERVAA